MVLLRDLCICIYMYTHTDVELDLSTMGAEARRRIAKSATVFGLHANDFVRLLDADQQLETELRLAKALEEEKIQLSVSALH